METSNTECNIAQMKEFESRLNCFLLETKINLCNFDEEVVGFLNLKAAEISKLTSEQCLIISIKLSEYCSSILSEINNNNARKEWVDEAISSVLAQYRKSFQVEALKFTRHEQKIHIVAEEDSFASVLLDAREKINLRHHLLNDQLTDYRKISDRFAELSRRKMC
jgi:hypothetical protein